jgi:hypothetical protein
VINDYAERVKYGPTDVSAVHRAGTLQWKVGRHDGEIILFNKTVLYRHIPLAKTRNVMYVLRGTEASWCNKCYSRK